MGDNSVMFVSSRFRDFVTQFEPGMHQFLLIDSLDPAHTTLTWGPPNGDHTTIRDGLRLGSWRYNPSAIPPLKPVHSLKAIAGQHLWRDPYWGREVVHCSNEFGDASNLIPEIWSVFYEKFSVRFGAWQPEDFCHEKVEIH